MSHHVHRRALAALALSLALPAAAQDLVLRSGFETGETGQAANAGSPLGANLDGVVDYSTSYNFVDVMKQSRSWITPNTTGNGIFDTDDAACLDLDADGNVRSLTPQTSQPGCSTPNYNAVATLFFFGDNANHYPSGRYIVTYQGEGNISYHFAATRNAGLSTPGRDVLDVNAANGGFMLRINAINTANPIRDIHVWMPGFDETTGPAQIFHPDFLRLIERYKVLRFMDWMNTNNSAQQEFADRPRQSNLRWTERGVPAETMIALANRLSADPWFNMPHRASDDYMTQFANLVKSQLRADLKVYVEYSNEVWNGQFQQGTFVEQQGGIEFGAQGSGFDRRLNWHAKRTAQMCDLWKGAFGAQASRVVCVLGAQAANAYTQTQAADCPMWVAGRPCSGHGIDAVAIAPYFGGYLGGPSGESTVQSWTLNDLFTEFNTGGVYPGGPSGGALNEVHAWITSHKTAANARGLHLITYEGGQHLAGILGVENNTAITALFTGANRDARMGTAYTDHLNFWKANGGELFVVFTASGGYGKFGSWGAAEYIDTPNVPKHQALMNFITNNPCWWSGCSP